MYMGAGCYTGDCGTKCEKWDSLILEVINEDLSLRTIGMKGDIYCVPVIVPEPVVSS
jgi:hypothetical protein